MYYFIMYWIVAYHNFIVCYCNVVYCNMMDCWIYRSFRPLFKFSWVGGMAGKQVTLFLRSQGNGPIASKNSFGSVDPHVPLFYNLYICARRLGPFEKGMSQL